MRKVLAVSPEGDAFVLVESEDEAHSARVLDRRQGRFFAPVVLQSVLMRGRWLPFTGDPSPILREAERLDEGDQTEDAMDSP